MVLDSTHIAVRKLMKNGHTPTLQHIPSLQRTKRVSDGKNLQLEQKKGKHSNYRLFGFVPKTLRAIACKVPFFALGTNVKPELKPVLIKLLMSHQGVNM